MTRWSQEQLDEYQNRRSSLLPKAEKKQSKYGNQKTEVDGIKFDSKKEAMRWQHLKHLRDTGCIFGLSRQVTFSIDINGQHICKYIADFVYANSIGEIVEYVKSEATRKLPVYRLKKKLMKAVHGIEIVEV